MIPSRPNATEDDIEAEFAPNSSPFAGNFTSNEAFDRVHANYTIGDQVNLYGFFAGTGQPSATIGVIEILDFDELRLAANIDFHGGSGNIHCQYYFVWNSTGNFPDPGDPLGPGDTKTPTRTATSAGPVSEDIGGLSSGTTYYCRLYYWNPFNQNEGDHKVTDTASATTNPDNLAIPPITDGSTSGVATVSAEWNYDTSTDQFQAQVRINEGNAVGATYQSDQNWGETTNPKVGTWLSDQAFELSDKVEIRVRAIAISGGQNTSQFSAWLEIQPGI